ncbi:hypothetical protein TIFTF001_045064 [Ficus carica]|uniref:Uncharacterized protein n=1 Tax=Ficus carica TaxID=3494 RepID=A0AA87YYS8_FICCA|nr:hypothetical protein TIFTF001_045064 [Ficus carica]
MRNGRQKREEKSKNGVSSVKTKGKIEFHITKHRRRREREREQYRKQKAENDTVERENGEDNGRQNREGKKAGDQIGFGGHFRQLTIQKVSSRQTTKGKSDLTAK